MDISATSDSVSLVSEGYQNNYCWILKLLRGPRIFKLINLCGNQFMQYTQAAYVLVPSVFGGNIPTAEFGRYRQKLLPGTKKENSQIFNEYFYLPLCLPVCF
jgi:hypothetical protein